tara:strand:- start:68 stop:262 length:195 start_codon:yes stop_codon:yes gene_type:complete
MREALGRVRGLPFFPRFVPPYPSSMAAVAFYTLEGMDESDSWLVAARCKNDRQQRRRLSPPAAQ